jgi:hypothetical protein
MRFGQVTTVLKEHTAPSTAIVTAIKILEEEKDRFPRNSASKMFELRLH